MLCDVARELAARGVELWLAQAHAVVRDLLQKEAAAGFGPLRERVSIDDALAGT